MGKRGGELNMGWIWDFLVLLTITLLILRLILQGLIPLRFGVIVMILLVVLRAVGRGRGGRLSRIIRAMFAVGLPITALLTFAIAQSQGDLNQTMTIIGGLGALLIALFGFYIMVRALFT